MTTFTFNALAPHFPNGFMSWAEAHHEIVEIISRIMDQDAYPEFLEKILSEEGRGGVWELCTELAFEFEREYLDESWEELDWFDTLESWVFEKVEGK